MSRTDRQTGIEAISTNECRCATKRSSVYENYRQSIFTTAHKAMPNYSSLHRQTPPVRRRPLTTPCCQSVCQSVTTGRCD